MRVVLAGATLLSLALGTSSLAQSFGDPANGFMNPRVAAAFIALDGISAATFSAHGAAVVLAPGVAVTNAHNANIVHPGAVLGRSQQYDLLFFRTSHGTPLRTEVPREGKHVIAYGQGENGELRTSLGTIRRLKVPVRPTCPVCAVQEAFVFESNAGPGFSGGPVLDAANGRLVGITFGYADASDGTRMMYAYDIARVKAELTALPKASVVASR